VGQEFLCVKHAEVGGKLLARGYGRDLPRLGLPSQEHILIEFLHRLRKGCGEDFLEKASGFLP